MDPSVADTAMKIGLWYFFSTISPITNKKVQYNFQYTNTLSILHLITASFIGGLLYYRQKGQEKTLPTTVHHKHVTLPPFPIVVRDLLPLGITRFIGMMLLLFGLKHLPVALVLTVKALDPIPTALFTYLILKTKEDLLVYTTVIPIILGVILSTNAEISAGLGWCLVALCLVIVDSLQNVITKFLLKKGTYTEVSLQFLSSSIALIFQLPVCIYNEGLWPLLDVLLLRIDSSTLFIIVLACSAFYGQVLFAFSVMNKVTNLTYSVANILKRIIQLLFAVIIFNNTITISNAMGMALAMLGVSLYSFVRSIKR